MFYLRPVALLFFFAYLLLSGYYATERSVHADGANYLFELINAESPFFTGRLGGLPVLLLPWLAVKAGLSVYWVILSYSLSFGLLYLLIFVLVVFVLKSDKAGWLLLFSLLLCSRDTFYYPVSEVFPAMAYACLFYALLFSEYIRHLLLRMVLLLACLTLCYHTHPVSIFLLALCLLFKISESEQKEKYAYISMLGVAFLVFALKPFWGSHLNTAESEGYRRVFGMREGLTDFFSYPSFRFLLIHSWEATTVYTLSLLLFVGSLLYYVFKKLFYQLAYVAGVWAAIVLVSVVVYQAGESAPVLGKAFAPLAFVSSFALFHEIRPMRNAWANAGISLLLAAALFSKFRDISLIGKQQKKRIALLEEYIQTAREKGVHKAIIPYSSDMQEMEIIPWSYPMESLLLSSFDSDNNSVTLYVEHTHSYSAMQVAQQDPLVFLSLPGNSWLQQAQLNTKYFRLPETVYMRIESQP